MKICMKNSIFENIPTNLPQELFEKILIHKNIRIERIISQGHRSLPNEWYDQKQNEWVMLIKGKAKLEFENEIIDLKDGDYINIPARKRHRVLWTTPDCKTIWLAIFY